MRETGGSEGPWCLSGLHFSMASVSEEGWELGREGFVGVFDSGVGGISVLRALTAELPHEDFHFFGDSANAPYGEKSVEEVRALVARIADGMLADGAKAIVIACNTATSTSAALLRAEHPDVPIIGVEPALKPAVEAARPGAVLVMATPVTLRLEKFQELERHVAGESDVRVLCAPCPGLASRIEQGHLDEPDVTDLLQGLVGGYRGEVGSVVLGCTHYPFVRRQVAKVLGLPDEAFFDGAAGTARQCRRMLEAAGLLADEGRSGTVSLGSSRNTAEELELYRRFLALPL